MGNIMSAAYRFAKQYDCMDVHDACEPGAAPPSSSSGSRNGGRRSCQRHDSAAGSVFGSDNDSTRDMVATLGVKPTVPQFDGKGFSRLYTLGKKLGSGAFADVFVADLKGARAGSKTYAAKRVVRRGLAKEDEKGLLEEVRILRLLQHSNVVSIHQFFQDDPEYYYMVMEYMSGGELFDRIVQKTYYNEEEARNLCRVLLDSVRYCHELGIVHRDLKPENILLASKHDDASIKLADFGFACSVLNGKVTTQCGSPGYVAPEILKAMPYGTSVDMWSIGVIIYTLLGGYPPFHDENQTRLFRRIKAGSFKFHDEYWSSTSIEAKDLIRKLLLVDPARRMNATQAMEHPWLLTTGRSFSQNNLGKTVSYLLFFSSLPPSLLPAARQADRSFSLPIKLCKRAVLQN
ncbi:unnamed protein product [Pylaiella littoralis]